jgi:hypothetical protein
MKKEIYNIKPSWRVSVRQKKKVETTAKKLKVTASRYIRSLIDNK